MGAQSTLVAESAVTLRRLRAHPSLAPFLKWPGGKSQELPTIAAAAPEVRGRFIDPFVGGGSVLLAVPAAVPAAVNDACPELIGLYRAGATADPLTLTELTNLAEAWDRLAHIPDLYRDLRTAVTTGDERAVRMAFAAHARDLDAAIEVAGPGLAERFAGRVERELLDKLVRMRRVESTAGHRLSDEDLEANLEGSVRSSLYMAVRARYNEARGAGAFGPVRLADFFFIREFTYAAMFRFNAKDEFNVPYGGVSYNRKSLAPKIAQLYAEPMRERLAATDLACEDFEPFLARVDPGPDDFVFVDPPYDSEFSDYDDRPFTGPDQRRLRDALESVAAKVMVVIKDTPAVRALYAGPRWSVTTADKTYAWTIKSRNDRSATHLTITNY